MSTLSQLCLNCKIDTYIDLRRTNLITHNIVRYLKFYLWYEQLSVKYVMQTLCPTTYKDVGQTSAQNGLPWFLVRSHCNKPSKISETLLSCSQYSYHRVVCGSRFKSTMIKKNLEIKFTCNICFSTLYFWKYVFLFWYHLRIYFHAPYEMFFECHRQTLTRCNYVTYTWFSIVRKRKIFYIQIQ